MCQRALGGTAGNWTCFAGMASDTQCVKATGLWNGGKPTGTGTCLCADPAKTCPGGRLP
jgi:hypothetical protein